MKKLHPLWQVLFYTIAVLFVISFIVCPPCVIALLWELITFPFV